jgi:hypothetical protein
VPLGNSPAGKNRSDMHAEESGHDNHHDDHADNVEDTHCSAPIETFRTRKYPDASIGIFLKTYEPLPAAITVITATAEQQENDDDDE